MDYRWLIVYMLLHLNFIKISASTKKIFYGSRNLNYIDKKIGLKLKSNTNSNKIHKRMITGVVGNDNNFTEITQSKSTCEPGNFTCTNYKCVPVWKKCNSVDDCGDNSDETDCNSLAESQQPRGYKLPKLQTCKNTEYECSPYDICMPLVWVCDGDNDCPDASDEKNCTTTTALPPEGRFKCDNNKYIPIWWICDSDIDCEDKSDEMYCNNNFTLSKCENNNKNCTTTTALPPEGRFKCDNNKYIPIWWKCDSDIDCEDKTDEMYCNNNFTLSK